MTSYEVVTTARQDDYHGCLRRLAEKTSTTTELMATMDHCAGMFVAVAWVFERRRSAPFRSAKVRAYRARRFERPLRSKSNRRARTGGSSCRYRRSRRLRSGSHVWPHVPTSAAIIETASIDAEKRSRRKSETRGGTLGDSELAGFTERPACEELLTSSLRPSDAAIPAATVNPNGYQASVRSPSITHTSCSLLSTASSTKTVKFATAGSSRSCIDCFTSSGSLPGTTDHR